MKEGIDSIGIYVCAFCHDGEGNILYALCLLSNLHKSFALNKIQEVKELNAEEISKRFKDLDKVVKNT